MDVALTKTELIDALYEKLQKSHKADIKNIVEALLTIMKQSIKSDGAIMLSGFGKFEAYAKKSRKGRNPHTEKPMFLKARKVVVFRVSKKLRLELNAAQNK